MKAAEATFLKFIKDSFQFAIPIYQRTYSWTEKECQQLWDDILRTGSNDAIQAHFTGSVVYIQSGLFAVTEPEPLLVIDGQQRLTTVMLILEALARRLGAEEPVYGFSESELRDSYLLNHQKKGEHRFKLLLTQTDKQSFKSLVDQLPQPNESSHRILSNFDMFRKKIQDLSDENLVALCKGLAKLTIVDVSLDRDQDNPQLIFESMNSTGRELSQADLIRNFILMGLEQEQQTRLYEEYWRPMEVTFGQEAYGKHFDGFMRYYLTVKTGDLPNVRAVYEAFKNFARSTELSSNGIDSLVADVHTYAGYYCAIALGNESDRELGQAFGDIRELKVDVAYPFFLELYHDYSQKLLSKRDLEAAIRLVEAYVFRRAVCGIPTNSLNKTFATFGRVLEKDRYLESIQAHFQMLPTYRRFPDDDEFKREIIKRDLYNFPRRSYWLRRLENAGRKERVPVDEYTIEHIMPQNSNLSNEWRDALGPDWQQIHEKWLHTLGNLTLTGYNSEYSDRPFIQKLNMDGGFKESPLKLNESLNGLEAWNEQTIMFRAEKLASKATKVWPAPALMNEELAKFQQKSVTTTTYSIEDHPHLAIGSPMHTVFDAFRSSVLELDPGVYEEFLKHYVAYKAETNFVDVVPQKNGLRLSLNIRFHELHDPRGLTNDITNLGRWGNGDAEVHLKKISELPYVMGLVRQAFEQQMGNGDAQN